MKIKTSELEKHLDDEDWYYISDEYAELLMAYALLVGGVPEKDSNLEAIRMPGTTGYILFKSVNNEANNSQRFDVWQVQRVTWEEYLE